MNNIEALQRLAKQVGGNKPDKTRGAVRKYNKQNGDRFDIVAWMEKHNIKYATRDGGGYTKYILDECPFDSTHRAPDSMILKQPDGAIGFKCLHDSCKDKTWRDVRLLYEPEAYTHPVTSEDLSMACLSDISEMTPEWFITDYIPKRQITCIAGDGGAGKTSIWCSWAAAASRGRQPEYMNDNPFLEASDNRLVYFFSAEDQPEYTLVRKLRLYDADMSNIKTIPISDERFLDIKFNSEFLTKLIEAGKPALCIFDPIQAFIPAELHMGDRNAMRQCLAPLIGLGEKYGTTFIIVVHSNKRSNAWGRNRIADSADIWDISRSVLIVGESREDGLRYISQEKSNYGALADTILFSIDGEKIVKHGTTTKRDRDFVSEGYADKAAPARDEAKTFILEALKDGEMLISDLDSGAKAAGISSATLRRAKTDLKDEKKIIMRSKTEGKGRGSKWYVSLPP